MFVQFVQPTTSFPTIIVSHAQSTLSTAEHQTNVNAPLDSSPTNTEFALENADQMKFTMKSANNVDVWLDWEK